MRVNNEIDRKICAIIVLFGMLMIAALLYLVVLVRNYESAHAAPAAQTEVQLWSTDTTTWGGGWVR